jgi:hypothetical protein
VRRGSRGRLALAADLGQKGARQLPNGETRDHERGRRRDGDGPAALDPFRIVNAFGAAVCLASALAVLGGHLTDPGYRAHYRDAIWFVVAYAAFYAWVLYTFAWSARVRVAQALGVVKALGAYAFLAVFPAVGRSWMVWTPGRYVYQLFDWGTEAGIVLMAYVFLARGAWNTVNAFVLTRDLWFPLRQSRPLFGRIVTYIPVVITVMCVWAFLRLARMNAEEFSPEAHEIANIVANDIQCDEIRAKPHDDSDVRSARPPLRR